MHGQIVHTMTNCGVRVWDVFREQTLVDRLPGFAMIVRAECASCRDSDHDPARVGGVEDDRVQAHAAGAGHPAVTGRMGA